MKLGHIKRIQHSVNQLKKSTTWPTSLTFTLQNALEGRGLSCNPYHWGRGSPTLLHYYNWRSGPCDQPALHYVTLHTCLLLYLSILGSFPTYLFTYLLTYLLNYFTSMPDFFVLTCAGCLLLGNRLLPCNQPAGWLFGSIIGSKSIRCIHFGVRGRIFWLWLCQTLTNLDETQKWGTIVAYH